MKTPFHSAAVEQQVLDFALAEILDLCRQDAFDFRSVPGIARRAFARTGIPLALDDSHCTGLQRLISHLLVDPIWEIVEEHSGRVELLPAFPAVLVKEGRGLTLHGFLAGHATMALDRPDSFRQRFRAEYPAHAKEVVTVHMHCLATGASQSEEFAPGSPERCCGQSEADTFVALERFYLARIC